MPQEFRLIGVPFEATDGTANINKVMPYQSAIEIDWETESDEEFMNSFMPVAPQIQLQRVVDDGMGPEGTYQGYWYVSNAFFQWGEGEDDYNFIPGWCDEGGTYADPEQSEDFPGELIPGVALWFKDPEHAEPPTFTAAGAVIMDDVDVDCAAEFRLRAEGHPVAAKLNSDNIVFTGIDGTTEIDWETESDEEFMNSFMPVAPQIQIQRLVDDGMGPEGTYQGYWYVSNAFFQWGEGEDDYNFIPGWCDEGGVYADAEQTEDYPGVIGVNAGFWTKGVKSPFAMKFKLNAAK